MIVRFTERQWHFFRDVIDIMDADVAVPFEPWVLGAQRASKLRYDVTMPYVGWLCFANFAFDHVYTERGGKNPHVPESWIRGFQSVVSTMGLHSGSPAFRHAAAFGIVNKRFPAWYRHMGAQLWPLPLDDATFVTLEPHVIREERRGLYTLWVRSSPSEILPPFTESEHRAFLRTGLQSGPLTPDPPAPHSAAQA